MAQEPFWKAYLNSPITFSFESEIKKAVRSCHNMQASPEAPVLRSLLKQCDGLLFLTVARAGVRGTLSQYLYFPCLPE